MKIVTLCREGSCCPVVKVGDKRVEIGEHGNLCVLTKSEWKTLRSKIMNKDIQKDRTVLADRAAIEEAQRRLQWIYCCPIEFSTRQFIMMITSYATGTLAGAAIGGAIGYLGRCAGST